jgi:accessory colonization factor AcfC
MSERMLHIFSAGAVAPPLEEAIDIFKARYETECRFTPGKPENLLAAIAISKKGDVISTGAEYIIDEAEDRGLVIKGSRKSLGLRRSVIVVPPDNPAKIGSLYDLCKENVRIGVAVGGCLKGIWDDIASKAGLSDRIRRNIAEYADACGSLMALIHQEKVDAIFGWNAFRSIWPDTCKVIELPSELQVFRNTVAAILSCTQDVELSRKFVDFLTSDGVRSIYARYGWIHKP